MSNSLEVIKDLQRSTQSLGYVAASLPSPSNQTETDKQAKS